MGTLSVFKGVSTRIGDLGSSNDIIGFYKLLPETKIFYVIFILKGM